MKIAVVFRWCYFACCVISLRASAQVISSVYSYASTGALHNGVAAAYADVDFEVVTRLALNMTGAPHSVSFHLTLPHSASQPGVTRCQRLLSGAAYNCLTSGASIVAYAAANTSSVRVTFSANLRAQSAPSVTLQGGYIVVIFLSVITDDLPDNYANDMITVSVSSRLLDGFDDVTTREYVATAIVDGSVKKTATTTNVRLVGPLVATAVSSYGHQAAGAEAGDTLWYQIHVSHKDDSTETALAVKFSVSLDSHQAPLVVGASSYVSSSAPQPQSFVGAAMLSGMSVLTSVTTTQYFIVSFQRQLLDAVLLGRPLELSVTLLYKDARGVSHSRVTLHSTDTKPIGYDARPLDSGMGAHFPVGKTIVIRKTFSMPKGTMRAFTLFAGFVSYSLPRIPLLFRERGFSSLQKPDYVTCDVAFVYGTDFLVRPTNRRRRRDLDARQGQRYKRATRVYLDADVLYGDIVNPAATGVSDANLTFMLRFVVDEFATGGPMSAEAGLRYNGVTQRMTDLSASVDTPLLSINQTVEMENGTARPNIVRFNVTVRHTATSNAAAYNVELTQGSSVFDVYWGDEALGPAPNDPRLTITGDRLMSWKENSLANGLSMILSYKAAPADSGLVLPPGDSYYNAALSYTTSTGSSPGSRYHLVAGCCITRVDVPVPDIFYDYGFTVLSLLCGILCGLLLILLLIFIIYRVCKKSLFGSSVHPQDDDSSSTALTSRMCLLETGGGQRLITSVQVTRTKGFSSIKSLSEFSATDSIVGVLAMTDRTKVYQELDSLDILSSVAVDEGVEAERNAAMTAASRSLVESLRENGDVSRATERAALATFDKNVSDAGRDVDADFQRDMERLFASLSDKNKEKLSDLHGKQEVEREAMKERVAHMSQQDQTDAINLLRKEHGMQRDELTRILKLEQDEEEEKLRKEYAIRRRVGLKGLQQALMDDVVAKGQLTTEQSDWLMREHMRNQATIDRLYDDEISRQRMVLEEKLSRRRILAERNNSQEDDQNEQLEQMATAQLQMIERAKKDRTLSRDEAEELMKSLEEDMVAMNSRQEDEKKQMQKSLHAKLSERKRKAIAEQSKKHQKELADFDKQHKSPQTQAASSVLESRQQLVSHQRAERSGLDNDLDDDHVAQLAKVKADLFDRTMADLKRSKGELVARLKSRGMDDDEIKKILAKHDRNTSKLLRSQEESRQKQNENFKMRLSAGEREWRTRREEERGEQLALRQHEDNVIRTLLGNQVAMSETERSRILQEHEKQMVKLENSLTLNKLQQKRMLEEKLARRRAVTMETLQRKQLKEVKRKKRTEEEEDDDVHADQMKMMKKHAEQRLAVLQSSDLDLESEMEEIRAELTKERTASLKEQEVALGAMLAQLQLEKAKQMAKIEEQQKAIHNLKSSLMDDLNDKGMLSDPDCQRVLQIHQQEEEKLNKKLDSQRNRQEKVLKKKLQERLRQKEEALSRLHEQQLAEAVHGCATSFALKIRRVILTQKHIMEMEQFRNRMELEINQTLEEVKRQNELRRLESCQEQELQFINGLVRLGKFHMSELDNVLVMLFPRKSEEERRALLSTLCEGYKEPPPSLPPSPSPADDDAAATRHSPPPLTRRLSSLEIRVMSATASRAQTPRHESIPEDNFIRKHSAFDE